MRWLSLRHVDDGLRKRLGRFLWKVVTDASLDEPMRILPGEFLGIGARIGMRRTVRVAFERYRGNGDRRKFRKALFKRGVFRLAFCKAETPAIIVDDDGDVIWIVEGRRASIERGVVEPPLRRCQTPDKFGELAAVFIVPQAAARCGEIKLIPPLKFGGGRSTEPCRRPGLRSDNR